MPTAKPRIAVTLNEQTFQVIARMAELQGCSRGSVVADLLESVAPALTRTVALLEAAAAAPKQVRDGLRGVVEDTYQQLVGVAGDSITQMDWLISELSGVEANPHVVTRGSGSGETRGSGGEKKRSKPVTARVPASPKGASDKGPQEAAEDAEFDAAYRGMIEAAEDHKRAREELLGELSKARKGGGKDAGRKRSV